MNDLNRFLEAQTRQYAIAVVELKQGEKQSHWMWYIFPQIRGLGDSPASQLYGIKNRQEALDYINHPILGRRLIECCEILMSLQGRTALDIFGYIDQLKLESCMTLFNEVSNNPIFANVLKKYYLGTRDSLTLKLLNPA